MAQASVTIRPPAARSIVHRLVAGTNRGPGLRLAMMSAPTQPFRAVLHPTSTHPIPATMVSAAIEAIRTGGYRGPITTPALTPDETTGFRSAGFHEIARLHLFRLDLRQPIPPPHGTSGFLLRRLPRLTRRQDQWIDAALAVDGAAFAVGERFDHLSIDEALNATPRRQVRFVVDPSPGSRPGSPASSPPLVDGRTVVGYAITGRAGHRGYLQRLAVHPAYQGRGVGALLCADAIAWARTGRAQVLAVNTREDNARAVRLYTRVGFEPVSGGLTVLGIPGSDGPL